MDLSPLWAEINSKILGNLLMGKYRYANIVDSIRDLHKEAIKGFIFKL